MPAYLVYLETLDPETAKISRDWKPVGLVVARGVAEARELARRDWMLKGNQRPHCDRNPYTGQKILRHIEAAKRKGKPITFAEAYDRMMKRRRGGKVFMERGKL